MRFGLWPETPRRGVSAGWSLHRAAQPPRGRAASVAAVNATGDSDRAYAKHARATNFNGYVITWQNADIQTGSRGNVNPEKHTAQKAAQTTVGKRFFFSKDF